MTLESFPKRLVVLGGGSAGWMSAAYLDRSFNRPGERRLEIIVVESEVVGRIGVGEATVPGLLRFLQFVGIDEPTFMRRTKATFKHGIQFEDWAEKGERYFHAFEEFEANARVNAGPGWLAMNAAGQAGRFSDASGIQCRVAEAGRAPKMLTDPDYRSPLPYAYHLDAEAFGDLLCEVATQRGVRRVQGDVVDVGVDADGEVTGLQLKNGETIEGDFFVDCSGFASLLIGKTLKTPFVSYADHLLCDRAVAIRAPHGPAPIVPPMTRAIAMSSGWMWRIGLQDREGIGYVYSSNYISDDEAEAELRGAAGVPDDIPARRLKMRVGRASTAWTGNVVAIGLAGGFIEPLESTGLHLVELALEKLVRCFPLNGVNEAARDLFNTSLAVHYDDLRDFIVAHYCLTRRTDTAFWREVAKPEHIPEGLAQRLAMWSDRHPALGDLDRLLPMFSHTNYQAVLYGMGWAPEAAVSNAAKWCPNPGAQLPMLEAAAVQALDNLPSHQLWLDGLQTLPVRTLWA